MARTAELVAAFARQADICAAFAAPLYAELCRRCADDVARSGPIGALVDGFAGDAAAGALPLRLLGAVHAIVLAGGAPDLAAHYPSAGGVPRWPDAWHAFASAVAAHRDAIAPWLLHAPQTNEVGRSAALLGGFLMVAASGQPLHLLELGSSAGLNLRWDRYGYDLGGARLGDAKSPVQLAPRWTGPPPPRVEPQVASRRGCDRSPLDVRDAATRARLAAFVWSDHRARLRTLQRALELAQRDDVRVERADAADWLERELRLARQGAVVVFHTSVWGYLDPVGQQRIRELLAAAGRALRPGATLHWLRAEDEPAGRAGSGTAHEVRLQSWNPGATADDRLLARSHPHGEWIEWLG
jgi:hypothetical protein